MWYNTLRIEHFVLFEPVKMLGSVLSLLEIEKPVLLNSFMQRGSPSMRFCG